MASDADPYGLQAVLPPLYAGWVGALLEAPIPRERVATCDDCVMVGEEAAANRRSFHASVKCCTYVPELPNFLVGAMLRDPDLPSHGRRSLDRRLDGEGVVTPLGIGRTPRQREARERDIEEDRFGRSDASLCPHYDAEAGGTCAIWRHRNGRCATWFCKYNRGATGMRFWERLSRLLLTIEYELAVHCVLEGDLDPGLDASFADRSTRPEHSRFPETPAADPAEGWGAYRNRRREWFRSCARRVGALDWTQVREIVGPEARMLARATVRAHRDLTDPELGSSLVHEPPELLERGRDASLVASYSPFDPIRVSNRVLEVLEVFDGRPTADAVAELERERGVELDPALLRMLVDFGLLRDGNDSRDP